MDFVFLEGVEEVADDAIQRSAKLLSLRERYRAHFQSHAATSAKMLELVDGLFRWPITSVNQAMESLQLSYQGATKSIQKLQEAEILEEVTGFKRNRRFIAKEIVEVITRVHDTDI